LNELDETVMKTDMMTAVTTDEITGIIRRCQKGDREAFGILVEKYRSLIFGTAYLMTRDRPMAEDAVQEALIKTWRYLPSLRQPERFKVWMLRIVVSQVKQQGRKKKPAVSLEQVAEPATDPDEMDCTLIRDETQQELSQALDNLIPEQREAVVLRYFSGLTVPEIAAATGWRQGTVKSRLSRALDRLGEFLRSVEGRGGGEVTL
jgi:RNA polymerase sigma-70 factor, ECF subfamily